MRKTLDPNQVSPSALKSIESFHSDVVDEVSKAVASQKVVVVGMAQNPFCKKACKLLDQKAVAYQYLEYGSYLKMWKERLAIKLWSGWPTFPQVFIDGKLIGGFKELEAHIGASNS